MPPWRTRSPDRPTTAVLRRLIPRTEFAPANGQPTRSGILLDVETTGLDRVRDEVIELAMIKFDYLPDGSITRVADVFTAFNEPSRPIPPEITELTGITDEIVAGHRIDPDAVAAFADDAVIVIAHNAGFDRKFSERYWPVFQHKAWGCSADGSGLAQTWLRWLAAGLSARRRRFLSSGPPGDRRLSRAAGDSRVRIARSRCAGTGGSSGTRPQENDAGLGESESPFDLKDELKRRGYRWSDGSDGRPKSWYIDVEESKEASEIEFLRKTIYMRDVEPRVQALSAMSRFSVRA